MTSDKCSIFIVALCLAGCGGAQTPTETIEEMTELAPEPSTDPQPDETTTTQTSTSTQPNDPSASTEAQSETPSTPEPTKPEPTPAAPKETKVEVKEASAARITDKHIVISGKILFETGKAKLKKVSYPILDDVVFAMQKHPEIIKIQVAGHTDSDGDANANKRLSKRRAVTVMKYLIREGVERDRLSAIGVGEDVPLVSNDTDEGKEKNRRVEFVIVERAKVKAVTHSTSTQNTGEVKSRTATDDETEELIKKRGLDKKPF